MFFKQQLYNFGFLCYTEFRKNLYFFDKGGYYETKNMDHRSFCTVFCPLSAFFLSRGTVRRLLRPSLQAVDGYKSTKLHGGGRSHPRLQKMRSYRDPRGAACPQVERRQLYGDQILHRLQRNGRLGQPQLGGTELHG
jgi:hypothetical protein